VTGHPVKDEAWYESQSGPYLLGLLTAEERSDFERALAADPALRADLDSMRLAVASLPLAAEERAPSANLRTRLAAAIDAEPNLVRPASTPLPTPIPINRAPAGWVINPLIAKMAAALVVLTIGSLLAWNFALRNDQSADTATVLAQMGPFDPAEDTGASGNVSYQANDGVLLLKLNDLPALAENEVYQVWFIKANGSAPEPSVAFRPSADSGQSTVAVVADPATFDIVAITREPGPVGSAAPTTKPILAANV